MGKEWVSSLSDSRCMHWLGLGWYHEAWELRSLDISCIVKWFGTVDIVDIYYVPTIGISIRYVDVLE